MRGSRVEGFFQCSQKSTNKTMVCMRLDSGVTLYPVDAQGRASLWTHIFHHAVAEATRAYAGSLVVRLRRSPGDVLLLTPDGEAAELGSVGGGFKILPAVKTPPSASKSAACPLAVGSELATRGCLALRESARAADYGSAEGGEGGDYICASECAREVGGLATALLVRLRGPGLRYSGSWQSPEGVVRAVSGETVPLRSGLKQASVELESIGDRMALRNGTLAQVKATETDGRLYIAVTAVFPTFAYRPEAAWALFKEIAETKAYAALTRQLTAVAPWDSSDGWGASHGSFIVLSDVPGHDGSVLHLRAALDSVSPGALDGLAALYAAVAASTPAARLTVGANTTTQSLRLAFRAPEIVHEHLTKARFSFADGGALSGRLGTFLSRHVLSTEVTQHRDETACELTIRAIV